MSVCHGRDREGMLRRGSVENAASAGLMGPPSSGFTPINPSRMPVQFVKPQLTLYERDLHDDILYKQASEKAAEVPVQKGKKRRATQASKGRAISVAKVWEYTDEGDIASQNHGTDFESSFPKRRKSAPAKRTNSVPSQSKFAQRHHSQEGPTPDLTHGIDHQEEDQSSQLTIPPNSGKIQTKKTLSKPRNTNFKPGPFRNPVITKPSISRNDEERPLAKPLTIHQGWISTQDSVKNQASGLSKTTLDKLAAFRYKSSADAQVDASAIGGSPQIEKAVEPVETLGGPLPASSNDYGFLSDNDSLFVDAFPVDQTLTHSELPSEHQLEQSLRAGQDHLHREGVFFSDAIWDPNADGTGTSEDPFSQDHFLTTHAMSIPGVELQEPSGSFLTHDASNSLLVRFQDHLPSNAGSSGTQHIYDSSNRVSVAQRAPARVMNEKVLLSQLEEDISVGNVHQLNYVGFDKHQEMSDDVFEQHQNTQNLQQDVREEENPAAYIRQPNYVAFNEHHEVFEQNHNAQHFQPDQDSFFNPYNNQDEAFRHLQRDQIASAHLIAKKSLSSHISDIQVARSDSEEPQMTPRDVNKDFELDDFGDEGIDDADLLAIASDGAIPETQPSIAGMHNGQLEVETSDGILAQDCIPRSPELLSDDEFPLEEGLEEEDLVSLPTHLQGVIETFQAPPSLEYPFGCGPMSGEVYDKSLQFSPPKSRPSSVLQAKAADLLLTDGYSPAKSQLIERTASDPAEEEDWSFIRSIDCANKPENPVASDPASDQENTSPDKTAKRAIPLGPQKQRKRSTYPKILPEATQSSTSQDIVLDDSHEYEPLQPFARPNFPSLVLDRSPIPGVTVQTFLRVCFRVGEMFREGARCNALKQDAIIELFARVTFSSREPGTTQQNFQFADLWHDRPPFPNGVLANYKTSGLAESESRAFVGTEDHMMARCIGRLRRNAKKNATGWFIDIINIRPTDWEEVKWTKRIVSAGLVKSEKGEH